MLFSSLEFIYLFLPITLILYFLCPRRGRNLVLLVVSLVFYGLGEPVYLFLMIFTIAADYFFGLMIARSYRRGGKPARILLAAVTVNIGLLGFFKYYDSVAAALGVPTLGLELPIGISFYTFQALSYVIDVYRREAQAQRSIIAFGTYVTLFPQLIAGPIVRYTEIDESLRERTHSVSQAASGISVFCVGLAKKVLLANMSGEVAATLAARQSYATVLGGWSYLVFYAFQIYFDFSGYSDMAIGLGRLFGFEFPENFRYPYISRSITEFWRRWHITLSSWFREYVYIPLGGNRRGRGRMYLNLLTVWSLTGIWHGAALNFLWWGLYFFVLLAVEKAFLKRILDGAPRILGHLYAVFFILIGWLIFSADGHGALDIATRIGQLFGIGSEALFDGTDIYELVRNLPFLCIMSFAATPLPKCLYAYLCGARPKLCGILRTVLCVLSLLLCTAYIVNSGYDPFLYFRF